MNNSLREVELSMHENWPECAQSMSLALLKMTLIQDIFKYQIEDCVSHYKLQHADFSVLATLRRSPEPYCLAPTDIYKSMLFSSGGLTKVLVRLVEAGLIERLENPEDKRSKLVKLNAKGKLLIETAMPDLHKREKKILTGLSDTETVLLENLLQKILDHNNNI